MLLASTYHTRKNKMRKWRRSKYPQKCSISLPWKHLSDFHPIHGKDHVSINDSPHVTDFPKNPLGLLEARGKSICYTSWIYLVFRNIPNVDLLSTPKYFQKIPSEPYQCFTSISFIIKSFVQLKRDSFLN